MYLWEWRQGLSKEAFQEFLTLSLRQTRNGMKNKRVQKNGIRMIRKGARTLYKSVIRDGKFLVFVIDGIFDTPLMELPTEELADKVAYELQTAWDQGVAWGSYHKQGELNGGGYDKNISETILKLKTMSPAEQEAYHQRVNRRKERVQKVEEARRWRGVLSWKSK